MMMKKTSFLFFSFALFIPSINFALGKNINSLKTELQNISNHYLKKYQVLEYISAVTLTVDISNASLTVCSGYTQYNGKNTTQANSLYEIGSITKSFVAAILLQLEATPSLHFTINDKLNKYFPEYPAWGTVSIKQLLNMTSGIPEYIDEPSFWQSLHNHPTQFWTPEALVALVKKKKLLFKPGSKWHYSNTNYILAGMLISKLTGNKIEDEMNRRFFAPNNSTGLHLENTYYIANQYPENLKERLIHGYSNSNGIKQWIPLKTDTYAYNLSYAGAAGAIISDTQDILHWVRALMTPGKVVAPEQFKELTTYVSTKTGVPLTHVNKKEPTGFGLGIYLSYLPDYFPEPVITYSGMTVGFRAKYIYLKDKNIALAATVNSGVDSPVKNHLLNLLANAYKAILKK